MPEEVKVPSCTVVSQKEYKSDYCPESVDDSSRDSSFSGEMNRSESSGSFDESNGFKQNGHEPVEIIPTRTIKTSVPKPAANPLQFVKIGPCDLYRSAQQQLQKVSEVKKPKKEVKDEMEDWQSNLDSWKCNRRKQQEHIIERVVEVKKLELEEHDRNKRRTKTFSEMMEERTSKGRKLSLPLYLEDESDDLSDLGISSSKNAIKSPTIPEENEAKFESAQNGEQDKCEQNGDDINSKTDTYDSAIQSYENRMKSISNGKVPVRKYNTRRGSAAKIEEKLSELEKIKNRSVSTTDLTENNKKQISIPKVNIFQRKEMFEKMSAEESSKNKLKDELPPVRSIKERLHSLEKQVEENTTNKAKNVPLTEISVKDRLSHINEKMRQNSTSVEKCPPSERTPSNKEAAKDETTSYQNFDRSKPQDETLQPNREYSSGRSSSSEDYEHVQMNHFHHRSLDSLQGHDSPNGFCFERVQSLECIDCCSNYPASVLSGDTDREDSGIHTADVSSSVSQADDFDLHADTSMDVDVKQIPPTIEENKADKSSHNDFNFVSQNDNVLESTDTSNSEGSNNDNINGANQNTQNDSTANDQSIAAVEYDLVDLVEVTVERTEPERESFVESNQIQVDVFDDDKNQNNSDLNEKTLVDENNDDAKCDSSALETVQEEVFSKRESHCEQAAVDSTLSEVTKQIECDDQYNVNNSYKEEEEPNNDFVNNTTRNQNCYETDSSEYASDFSANPAEQRIDYLYLKNNQYLGGFPNESVTQEPALFAFESSTAVEPPKEKPPPPPPLDINDDELDVNENKSCLRRMDSTKRIKKELRQKRSSFLGIEGFDDDSYLEPESVKPPPDMTTFLQEERRLEKLLYRQSICSESDSTQGESRDSGVELDKNQIDENSWMPENTHNRQDSETYANTSTTSEEDEIIKKEREILEILELEEQRHYETESKNEYNNLGEKLVQRLQELERQKTEPCWSREQELLNNQRNLANQQNYIKYEEPPMNNEKVQYNGTENVVQHEVIEPNDSALLQQQWARRSLQDITQQPEITPSVNVEYTKPRVAYRNSMPNIQQELTVSNHYHRVPPPIPPNKPSAHFREPAVVSKASSPQQMSKQTLQALSAVPRSKIVATDSWVLSKKKPRQEAYNYQHWLIQEAEHRRITEYQQRHRNDNPVHSNYVNTHCDYVEQNAISNGDNRSHQNRSLYAHPQMLPYRNVDQYHDKNYNKPQNNKPLPDSVIQTLTQRVQNRFAIADGNKPRRRDNFVSSNQQEKMLSVSGKKKCSHCGDELGRGAAMIIESLRLFYHIDCFKCCVCCVQLGDGLMGTDVRVRNDKLHCHSCYSNDEDT
ncbi:uncharacterized protein DDB_G0283357 isoform X2 [Planococcus citri]|uniref:uncharacterized protein DDB_G0283357 isoform X2 n=1 Tax=Planococcus citri TaxID=170843 RepID=UPI0031F7FD96